MEQAFSVLVVFVLYTIVVLVGVLWVMALMGATMWAGSKIMPWFENRMDAKSGRKVGR